MKIWYTPPTSIYHIHIDTHAIMKCTYCLHLELKCEYWLQLEQNIYQ